MSDVAAQLRDWLERGALNVMHGALLETEYERGRLAGWEDCAANAKATVLRKLEELEELTVGREQAANVLESPGGSAPVSCVPACPVREALHEIKRRAIEADRAALYADGDPTIANSEAAAWAEAAVIADAALAAPCGPPAAPSEAGIKNRRCPLVGTIVGCVRCGGMHGATAYYFASPPKDFTAWATCPVTGDPILIELPAAERGAPPPAPPEARG